MLVSLTDFGSKFSMALALPAPSGLQPTPLCRNAAIMYAQKNEKRWLTSQDMVAFINYLRRDATATDVYMVLDEEDIRKDWVCTQLDNIGASHTIY